jgi:TonB family protein
MRPLLLTFLVLGAGYLSASAQTRDTLRTGAVLHITDHYPNGQVEMTETYENGRRNGDFVAYFPSGKISAKAKFANGKQVSDTTFNEDGFINPDIIDFIRESDFPGGTQAWLNFINKHVRYPASARRRSVVGTVVVQFIVDEHGKVPEVDVIRSIDPSVDAEAMRVIYKSSGKWYPALYGGRFVKSYKKQSIVFGVVVE